jgi:8-oxo-dGTP pyrophosphatase MutT (NUDIX family)
MIRELQPALALPEGARPAARVLLLDDSDRLLYLHAREGHTGRQFWVLPGGGLEGAESFAEAAIREVKEETGLNIVPGRCIWTRHHLYEWEGRNHNQYEVFFVARTSCTNIEPPKRDSYIFGHKWWSLMELTRSDEHFAPTRIAMLLDPILDGDYPAEPFDCGV